MDEKAFDVLRNEHKVEADTGYDIEKGGMKYGYVLSDPKAIRPIPAVYSQEKSSARYTYRGLAFSENDIIGKDMPVSYSLTSPAGVNRDAALQAYDAAVETLSESVTAKPVFRSPATRGNPVAQVTYHTRSRFLLLIETDILLTDCSFQYILMAEIEGKYAEIWN